MKEIVCRNSRAAVTLKDAEPAAPWLGVSLDTFGRQTLVPAAGLISVGDAAAFIDPFAGSGILMALQNGELAASVIGSHWERRHAADFFTRLAKNYRESYARKFDSRLRTCSWMRRAAFVPQFAESLILLFTNDWLRRKLSEAMRRGTHEAHEFQIDQSLPRHADIS
jgi:flavin-dependent dehydrogenase